MKSPFTIALFFILAVPLVCLAQVERIESSEDGVFLGELMLSEKKYSKADACLKRALKLARRDDIRLRIASRMLAVYAGMKDLGAMEKCYHYLLPKMSEKNKNFLNAKYAANLIAMKEVEKAKKVLDSSSFSGDMSDDEKARMYYVTAHRYRSMQLYKKAGELYFKAAELASNPKKKAAYLSPICNFPGDKELDGRKKMAAEWYFKQKGLLPYKGLATRSLVAICNRDKEYDEAVKLLKAYLKEEVVHKGMIYYALAKTFEAKGDTEKAVEYYKKALLDKKLGSYERNTAEGKIKK